MQTLQPTSMTSNREMPDILCVDCDGTLIRSDLLQEALLRFVKSNPAGIFQVLWWLLKGRARLKYELAKRVCLSYDALAFNQKILDLVKTRRAAGGKVFLVTAAAQLQATQLAEHLDCFDGAYGSSEETNLKGARKAALLEKLFGKSGF